MSFTIEILRTMESVEITDVCGLDKRKLVMQILEQIICDRYGSAIWNAKYRGFAEDTIDFIISLSKNEILIAIYKNMSCCSIV